MKPLLAAALACFALPAFADQGVTIPFRAEIGGKPFSCMESYSGIGLTGSTVQVADFRLYVSNVRVIDASGKEVPVALTQDGMWQLGGSALLDFENASGACANGTAETNTALHGSVPEGQYTGLAFDIGLPFDQNHGDATLADSPLNLTAMFWSWQGGYKFVKIDMATSGQPLPPPMPMAADEDMATQMAKDKPKGPMGWELHLGSTGCAADSMSSAPAAECANPNRVAVRLDGFMPGMAGMDTVVLDPAPVLAGADVDVNAPDTAPGCMSFPGDADCPAVMKALGLPYDGAEAGTQAFATLH